MKLTEIKGVYNAIFSLGDNCIPALKLRQFNLRKFAGPFDWVGSPKLPNVTNLIENNFSNFLNEQNLLVPQYASEEDLLVIDTAHHIAFTIMISKLMLIHFSIFPTCRKYKKSTKNVLLDL
ncbi:DUF1796 family putative cysteine peptidase [Niallia taxi]|nr:DUF1796 family putative cysteine peptidase [Niallia taxi]MDE5055421.1 DUF1796 family putative cysteine peptidase [Niallia taxi]